MAEISKSAHQDIGNRENVKQETRDEIGKTGNQDNRVQVPRITGNQEQSP